MKNRLEQALDYTARCIAAGDESLLPLFERLDRELEDLSKKNSALFRARNMSKEKQCQNTLSA